MYRIRVIDIETTGMDPATDAICEAGYTDVLSEDGKTWTVRNAVSVFVRTDRPMPVEAMAVHHLTDAMLRHAATRAKAIDMLSIGSPDLYAAHNAAFERSFLPELDHMPWVCTYKCALRLWPEAPGHKNQELRYWLGVDDKPGFDRFTSMPPHRAGPDAYVTAWLLQAMLLKAPGKQLVKWTREPAILPKVTFGKHRGRRWEDLPDSYIEWLVTKATDLAPDIMDTALHHLRLRQAQRETDLHRTKQETSA